MRIENEITLNQPINVDYHQFTLGPFFHLIQRIAGVMTWPLVVPLALLSRLSDFAFRTCSEFLSLFPYLLGVIIRQEFYRLTLKRCGKNVSIGFGAIFLYRDIEIGDNVLIGNYCVVHFCDFGSYVLVADACQFLSGAHYHNYERTDIPMALQGGRIRRIRIESDCWIGAGAIVMNDVSEGSIIGAGSIVRDRVQPYAIVAGNPARFIKSRGPANAAQAQEEGLSS